MTDCSIRCDRVGSMATSLFCRLRRKPSSRGGNCQNATADNRLINCRPYRRRKANSSVPEKKLATRLKGMATPADVSFFWSLVARKLLRPPKHIRAAVLMYRRALGCFVTGPCCRARTCFARRQHTYSPSQGLPCRSVQCWIRPDEVADHLPGSYVEGTVGWKSHGQAD